MTPRQSLCWDLFLADEMDRPSRDNYYQMANTLAIYELMWLTARAHFQNVHQPTLTLGQMRIQFGTADKQEEKPETPEEATKRLMARHPRHLKAKEEHDRKKREQAQREAEQHAGH